MTDRLPLGLSHSATLTVDPSVTVPALPSALGSFADMPAVFATAYLVAFVEATCIAALRPYLGAQERSVGTHIDISHSAATPIGMQVTVTVVLDGIEGRRLRFRVECRDEHEVVGAGDHERFIVDSARFAARVEVKGRRPAAS